jgi:tetratricopeptide (TPR) repeat protein
MKTLTIIPILLGLLALLASILANAGDKFTETMQKNIEALYSAKSADEIQALVNAFERIGDAEKTRWEPFYYAAYGSLTLAMREQEDAKKDALLDRSLKSLEKAIAIKPAESECAALEGFVHMIRVSVDPASRGQQYSGMAFQSFGKALSSNPDNPRALTLLAQMQYGTAQFFGSSTNEACGTLTRALEKFDTFKSENPLAPQWGKGMAERMKSQCN